MLEFGVWPEGRSEMSAQIFELGTAAVFLFLAVVGGGVTVKEISIPRIPGRARVALALLGVAAAGLAVFTNSGSEQAATTGPGGGAGPSAGSHPNPASPGPLPPCRHPAAIPPVGDGTHTEADARKILSDGGLFNVVTAPAFDPGAPKGVVVGVDPPPGTVLCPRELVTIKVTR